jgi:AcrR family transcriptional regulator
MDKAESLRSTSSPRRERRRLEMRSRILEAALGRFREAGFETTTVADICEAADIAYGTFFNHFPSKLDLLRAIVDESQRTLALSVEELSKQAGPATEMLSSLFELLTRNAREFGPGHRDLVEQMVTLGHQESPADTDRRLHTIFRSFLECGVARGDVCEEELDALTEIVLGAYTSITLGWVHFDDYPMRERSEVVALLLSRILTHPSAQHAEAVPRTIRPVQEESP